jgi:Fe2+ or Zn2+ uptake regulation protein
MIEAGILRQAALDYLNVFQFSVIPILIKGKIPMVRWQDYQSALAEEGKVVEWWTRWPDANVGVVTGKVSGITVVDVDTDAGMEALKRFLPPLFITPTVRTQKGGHHLYFQYVPGLSNRVRAIEGIDVRNDGGFVVAPPSQGEHGEYRWLEGMGLGSTDLEEMPPTLVEALKNSTYTPAAALPARTVTPESLVQGSRNDSVFHAALALVKGGISGQNELFTLIRPIGAACTPPLPYREIAVICDSALKHVPQRLKTVADDVLDWINQASGNFDVNMIYSDIRVKDDKAAMAHVRQIIKRMVDGGDLISFEQGRYTLYRHPDPDLQEINLDAAVVKDIDFQLPLGLHNLIRMYPGNIVVIAGEPNVGKTAFMLESIRMNMDKFDMDYYTSEMSGTELKMRRDLYRDYYPDLKWKWHPYEKNVRFNQEIARPGRRGHVSVVDFLEVTDEFYRIGTRMSEIHEALGGEGLALVAIQKGWHKDLGRGGDLGMEKPRVYVTMSYSQGLSRGMMRIVKAKSFRDPGRNPNGLVRPFSIHYGHHFESAHDWMTMEEYDSLMGTENGKQKEKGKRLF